MSSARPCRIDKLEQRRLLAAVTFDIDSELSVLTVAARGEVDDVGSVKLEAQEDGLDSAHFGGTLVADFSSKGIRFFGGSEINGIPHDGDFSPGGGDAVYAVEGKAKKVITLAELEASVRDLSLDITSSARKQTTGAKHKFQIRKAEMEINSGSLDYEIDSKFGDADGIESLDDLQAKLLDTNGRVTGKKGSRIITIPIEVRFTPDFDDDADGVFTFKGQIVGREQTASGQAFVPMRAVFSTVSVAKERNTADDVLNLL